MSNVEGMTVHAILEAVCVRFDLQARKSVPLDADFIDRATAHLIPRLPSK